MNNITKLYQEPNAKAKSVLFIVSKSVSDIRLVLAATWLSRWGYRVTVVDEAYHWMGIQYDLVIANRPHMSMCNYLNVLMDGGAKVVIDMDDDFYSIPRTNPAYKFIGKGCLGYHEVLRKTIGRASCLVTTTEELSIRYGRNSTVINNYFDEENPLWTLPDKKHPLSIGWVGTDTHREDFSIVQPAIERLLEECSDLRLVIGLDESIYNRFYSVPEKKKLFYLGLPYDIYPVFYKDCDVVVSPLGTTTFNLAKSDIKLLEADASGTPWIASPLPFYKNYYSDGNFACSTDEWYSKIKQLLDDPYRRKKEGNAGIERSKKRTSEVMAHMWKDLIDSL